MRRVASRVALRCARWLFATTLIGCLGVPQPKSDLADAADSCVAPVGCVAQRCGGICYALCPPATWSDGSVACEAWGGHLACVDDVTEDACVSDVIAAADEPVWIGLVQDPEGIEPDGGWGWVCPQPLAFTNWVAGSPNDSTDEECGVHEIGGAWEDRECVDPSPFLCER